MVVEELLKKWNKKIFKKRVWEVFENKKLSKCF